MLQHGDPQIGCRMGGIHALIALFQYSLNPCFLCYRNVGKSLSQLMAQAFVLFMEGVFSHDHFIHMVQMNGKESGCTRIAS